MKASTTNGVAEPTTETKPVVVVEELTTGQRIVEVLEKRIRNLEKRKTKLDTIQKESLRGKEIHPGQQEALDKRDDVINQIESLKEMLDQTAKIVQDAKRGEKKEKDKARREAHATGVDRYQRIIRLLNIANHVDHDQFVRDLSDKASLEPLQGEFLLSVLSLLAGLGEEGSASKEWQAQAMHALFDCPSTFATSVKAPIFDSCKHVNVKQARELLDTLFDGVLESVALESVRTSSSAPPQTPNPSVNGDGLLLDSTAHVDVDQLSSTVDDPDNFSPPEAESRASVDRQLSAVDMTESKMVYAADLEKEIIGLEQRQSSVRVPSPPPRIALPGEEEETKPVDPSQQVPRVNQNRAHRGGHRRTHGRDGPSSHGVTNGSSTGAIGAQGNGGQGHVGRNYNGQAQRGGRQQRENRPPRQNEDGWQTQGKAQREGGVKGAGRGVGQQRPHHGARGGMRVGASVRGGVDGRAVAGAGAGRSVGGGGEPVLYDRQAANTQPQGW